MSADEESLSCLAFADPKVFCQPQNDVVRMCSVGQRLADAPADLQKPSAIGRDTRHVVLKSVVDERDLTGPGRADV